MREKPIALLLALVLSLGVVTPTAIVNAQEPEAQQTSQFSVQVSVSEESIVRGQKQSINVETNQPSEILGSINYASSFTRAFTGTTDDDGNLTYEWKIGPNSKPGTFVVKVIAISLDNNAAIAQTSFTVTDTAAPPVEEQEQPNVPVGNDTSPVVDNGTITEGGNGTVIVPEEPIDINIPGEEGNITIPSINDTIPSPVPINETSQNETIPIEIPVNSTTNQTVPVPELPTNETVSQNQTQELPTEIPINSTTGNVTEPIEIPINSTTGNETIAIPPIDVQIPDNATLPTQNQTTPAENQTDVTEIIEDLDDRTSVLENRSATGEDIFESVGTAIEEMGDAISIIPGLTEEEQAELIDSITEVMQAIQQLR